MQSENFGLYKIMARKRLDTDSLPAIARRLRALRHWLRLSQSEMAERLGIPKNTWAGYETGHSRIPLDTGLDVYRIWHVDPKWVYMGIDVDVKRQMLDELNKQLAEDDRRERERNGGNQNGAAA